MTIFDFRKGEASLALEVSGEKYSNHHKTISEFLEHEKVADRIRKSIYATRKHFIETKTLM